MREGREPKVSRAIIAAMADVGPDGITMQELVARSNSTQKSLRTLLSRLRERGHPFWVVRDAAGVRVKIMHAHERPMQHLPLIIKRLADAGDVGVSRDDLSAGIPKLSFNRSKSRCAKEGSLFASVRRGLGDQVRYFGSAAARDAYAASRPARVKAVKVKAPPKPPKAPKPPKCQKAPTANNGNSLRVYNLLLNHPKGLYSREICERLEIGQRQLDCVVNPSKRTSKYFIRIKDPGISGGKWSPTRSLYLADTYASFAASIPAPVPKQKTAAATKLDAGPADYSRAVRTVCPSYVDQRYTAQIGDGHQSALDPRQCRPWALAAVGVAA